MMQSKSDYIKKRKIIKPFLAVLPVFILFLLFLVIPVLYEFIISFFDWGLLDRDHLFVGFANYLEAFRDPVFLKALGNTFLYTLGSLPLTLILALLLALLVNRVFMKGLFRTIYFIPVVCSMVVVATVWKVIYHPEAGILNQLSALLGLPSLPWLMSPKTALISVIIVSIWKQVGFYMVIYLAGLQTIPRNYYEAADLEGINLLQSLRYITLPLLKPIIFFTTVIGVIGSLQVFSLVFVITEQFQTHGGPANSTMVYALYLYEQGFKFLNIGYASALAFIGFIIIAFLTYIQFRVTKQEFIY